MGLSNGVNDMYKEKLINYINNSPSINFIINVDGEFVMVEFVKKNDSYFFLSKIGARVREVRFPLNFKEIKDIADILITYDAEKIKECKDKTTVYIGKDKCEEATYSYESFDEFLKNNFITKHKDDDGNE